MNNRKPLTKEEFEYFCKKLPRINVEVILIHQGGVVLTKRIHPPDEGYWHIPGGAVMIGETLEDAVLAVAKEELGVEVSILKFLQFFYYPAILEKAGQWPIGGGFLTQIRSGKLKKNKDASEIRIFKQIPDKTVHDQKEFLEDLAANDLNI